MGYTTYNKSLYRTGFRPYGQTNAWAASQLNGVSMHEALGQSHPFMPRGGWGLHGSASFHPWVLEGMGDDASFITDFSVPGSVTDPIPAWQQSSAPVTVDPSLFDVQYGAPGAAPTASTYEEQAGVQAGNVAPTNWLSSLFSAGATVAKSALAPGPSPRVNVPVAPAFASSGSIIKGVPDVLLYGLVIVAGMSLMSGGRRR